MPVIRTANEIVLSLLDFFRSAQPSLDTKPGTVSRDLFIEAPASVLSSLYDEISNVTNLQSVRLLSGTDLDKFAQNYGLVRESSTPSSGIGILTFASLYSNFSIPKGSSIGSKNGVAFSIETNISISTSSANYYKSIAEKYRSDLDFVGIKDQYAVEINLKANSPGTAGNIGKYYLNSVNVPGISNVTNAVDFKGGLNQQDDIAFRNVILSSLSGASTGTALGYKNKTLGTTGVIDALVIEPGDPLMTRDGTIVSENSDGTLVIISEGSGGKIDIIALGFNLQETLDTFIYKDKSNFGDPTNVKNDYVIGQIAGDENKTINRKRIDNIKNGTLPNQPVSSLLEVSGSQSGNFIEKKVDSNGIISGNYELIKDSSTMKGSPWGKDKLHWISDRISNFQEDRVKSTFNGQDALTFSDVLAINKIQQNVSILNENPRLGTTDRSIIQLLHTPLTNVTRVFNATTGERYVISNQNPNGSGSINTYGTVKISGNSLPSSNDILQVDYEWIVDYDPYSDFDGKLISNNPRSVEDSVDWGYSSLSRSESIVFALDQSSNYYYGRALLNISSVINAYEYLAFTGLVQTFVTGSFADRKYVFLRELSQSDITVYNVFLKNTKQELYLTAQNNGSISINPTVVGTNVRYNVYIILPSDTMALDGDFVDIIANKNDVYNSISQGNFNNNQITIPFGNVSAGSKHVKMLVNYVSSTPNLYTSYITSLPTSRLSNGFALSSNVGFTKEDTSNVFISNNLTLKQDLSLVYYLELPISSFDFYMESVDILHVIRSSDHKVLWSHSNPNSIGTLSINGTTNNYQIYFNSTYLTNQSITLSNDFVFIEYKKRDLTRYQPNVFENEIIKTKISQLQTDANLNLYVQMDELVSVTGVEYMIYDPNQLNIDGYSSDGYIAYGIGNLFANVHDVNGVLTSTLHDGYFVATTCSTPITSIPNLEGKKIRILDYTNQDNNNLFDISSFNYVNRFNISNKLSYLNKRNVSIIRIADSKEIWTESGGTYDYTNNRLVFTSSKAAAQDYVYVMFYKSHAVKETPTRLSVSMSDSVVNTGTLSILGHTIGVAKDIVFSVSSEGLTINLLAAIKKAVPTYTVGSSKLIRVCKLEKVLTVSNYNDTVISSVITYNLKGSKIQDNRYYDQEFLSNELLNDYEITLSSSETNVSNAPQVGDKIRATFYYVVYNDLENLAFTKNGTLYTNKKFSLINKIYISSGFTSSSTSRILISSFNQPNFSSRYQAYYDYKAPKQNERITLRYDYNKIISDITFRIENSRPVNADVIVKEATELLIDVTMNIVVSSQYLTTGNTVAQNVKDAIITFLTNNTLGGTIDSSDLVNQAYNIIGVDRARILYFNKTGNLGQLLSITAKNNEYISPNNIIVNLETR